MPQILDTINWLLGLNLSSEDITTWQMGLRSVVVYIVTVAIARIAGKRFFGQLTAFDIVLGIILGSILSRAVNGTAPFYQTIAAGLVLVLMHILFATLTYYSHKFGIIFKGEAYQLVESGEILWDAMWHNRISEKDLMTAVRLNHLTSLKEVGAAYIERNGQISVIPKPYTVEVDVQAGVQRVRIDLF